METSKRDSFLEMVGLNWVLHFCQITSNLGHNFGKIDGKTLCV